MNKQARVKSGYGPFTSRPNRTILKVRIPRLGITTLIRT